MELQGRKVKIIIIGDFHIPERATDIPSWIMDKLDEESKKKLDLILCTGDVTSKKIIKKLEKFAPVKCVAGNMDYEYFPEKEVIIIGAFRILLFHSSNVYPRGDIKQLDKIRKKENANIVVYGHTHKMSFDKIENGQTAIFLNPGTATGVWGGSGNSTHQTFIVLIIEENNAKIRFFEDGNLKKEVFVCILKKP